MLAGLKAYDRNVRINYGHPSPVCASTSVTLPGDVKVLARVVDKIGDSTHWPGDRG
jgi:hypothetical protein